MNSVMKVLAVNAAVLFILSAVPAAGAEKKGEALFKEHCASCHPNGGNIINPKKSLSKKDLQLHQAWSEDAIVKIMRNPGPGMLKFDEKTISNHDAHEIAEFILKSFAK